MIFLVLVACGSTPEVWPESGTPVRAQEVVTAGGTTCAHLDDGRVACWGAGETGQLGREVPLECAVELDDNHTSALACSARPIGIEGLGKVDAIDVGGGHVCALAQGDVKCWGGNPLGVLGFDTRQTCILPWPGMRNSPCQFSPGKVPGLPKVSAISAGSNHSCALTEDGTAYCWGGSALGLTPTGSCIGVDGRSRRPCMPPTAVPGLPPLKAIEAGTETSCALDRDGGVWCWGQNELGKVGDGTAVDRIDPVKIAVPPATEVVLGPSHGCALTAGEVWCWGSSWHYETGTKGQEACPARMGTNDLGFHVACEPSPVRVPGVTGATQLRASGANTCVQMKGRPVCWGTRGPGLLPGLGSGPRTLDGMPRETLGKDFACGRVDGVVHCLGTDRGRAHGSETPLADATALEW